MWSLLSKRLSIQPADHHRLGLMIPVFLSMGMGEVLGISSSASIFNVRYGVEFLPFMYVFEAIGLLLVTGVIADMSGRMERPRFFRRVYGVMAGLVLVNGLILLFSKFTSVTLWPVYYPILLVSSMVIFFQLSPLIWLIAVDICPTQQAKRLFPILAGSSTIGCIAAGFLGKLLAPLGVEFIYLLWALFLLIGGYFLFKTIRYYIVPLKLQGTEEGPNLKESILSVYQSRFLLNTLAFLTLIMTLYFLMDYQFNTIARMSYSNEADLAGFLAIFLAVSNIVAVIIELGFLNRIMERLGVSNVTLLVTAGVGFCYLLMIFLVTGPFVLGAVFISYLITKIMVNVLGAPSYQLLFKVVPTRERDGVRFLVEALFVLGGMLGGAVLSGLNSQGIMAMPMMCIVALLLAAIAFYIAWKTKALYLKELIKCIVNGVQDLKEDGASLLGHFVPPGFLTKLFSLLHHPDDRKRSLALEIAEQLDPKTLEPWIHDLLQDSNADVKSSGLRYCLRLESSHDHKDAVLACCSDDVPEVRAAAIALLPSLNIGEDKLYEALTDADPLVVAKAVITICRTEQQIDLKQVMAAVDRCLDGGSTSAAIICQAIGAAGFHEYSPRLITLLDGEPGLRAAACAALGKLQYLEAIPQIISVYAEADLEFHKVADQALIDMGEKALPVLLKQLNSRRDLRSWLAVIKALAVLQIEGKQDRVLIDSCLSQLNDLVIYRDLPVLLKGLGLPALNELAGQRCQEICAMQMEACWSVLAGIYDPFVIEQIRAASREKDIELRETSLEVLSEGLADRRLARAMLEALHGQDQLKATWNPDNAKKFLEEAQVWTDYWLSEIASGALSGMEGGSSVKEQEMLSLLDKVMILKSQELFSCLQLEELGLLARVARQEIYPEGTELVQEGMTNSKLYVIIRGNIELSAHSGTGVNATIAVLGAGKAAGDTTVLDGAISPVSAQVILDEAALLTIDGQDIQRLCSLYPSIAAGFIKAISTRVRKLEQMLIKMA
ncbi:MAG: transcriptional activator FtrB [Pelotomaculum sp. PtaU1.Bin065]|nr:MAG: transcriptional activator FtrB [Pelotomaculum sp. PtaU1.Bin065]